MDWEDNKNRIIPQLGRETGQSCIPSAQKSSPLAHRTAYMRCLSVGKAAKNMSIIQHNIFITTCRSICAGDLFLAEMNSCQYDIAKIGGTLSRRQHNLLRLTTWYIPPDKTPCVKIIDYNRKKSYI